MMPFRDWYGLDRLYYQAKGDRWAQTACKLLGPSPQLDGDALFRYLAGSPDPERSSFAGIRAVPPGFALERSGDRWCLTSVPRPVHQDRPLDDLLTSAVVKAVSPPGRVVLALSGGLDSALILALLCRAGVSVPPVYVLDPQLPGYSEREQALATARFLHVEAILVPVTERDYLDALPECVFHAEAPFYNLHPVSRYLLASRVHADGFDGLVTGDGADQVFAGVSGLDYLPLVAALSEGAGVNLRCPFLDEVVIAEGDQHTPTPHKAPLRALAQGLLPGDVVTARKQPRLAPPMDLSPLWNPQQIEKVAQALGHRFAPPANDRERVSWLTLSLLYEQFIARV